MFHIFSIRNMHILLPLSQTSWLLLNPLLYHLL